MSSSPSPRHEKKHWWLSTRKVVERHAREARALLVSQQPTNVAAALPLLDAALSVSPRHELALELKARCLLFLRRFREVADMLQDYIPSFRSADDEDDSSATTATSLSSTSTTSSSASSTSRNRDKTKLSPTSDSGSSDVDEHVPFCFSVSDLKRRLWSNADREGQWRYIVLGHACYHLGLMEDALVLLQTGRRLAAASGRRESHDLHDDKFSGHPSAATTTAELDGAATLLNHIKLLLRRRSAAVAALDANLPAESIRHFSKILDSRRSIPNVFAAGCLIGRAAAHRAASRITEAISDCNRALAVDPGSIQALRARSELLESVGLLPDCLRDLEHLKLLYDAVLWDRKLPGPPWRAHHGVRYLDISGSLKVLMVKIPELRQRVGRGEGFGGVDYYVLFGLRRGCGRSELERAHLLLSLKHRPEKAAVFVDRVEFAEENRDVEAVRDQAKMSAMVLYRLLHKGYSSIMATIAEEEEMRRKEREEEVAKAAAMKVKVEEKRGELPVPVRIVERKAVATVASAAAAAAVFQGVFCRDLAAVSSLLSRVGCAQEIPVKYEAMSF